MPNALKRLLAHPRSVVADVVREARRAAPRETVLPFALAYRHPDTICFGIDRRLVLKLGWYLNQRLVDKDSHWVEV